jgi:UDP-4-amino-4,6-dideoxy-N-acetyl-beta-L-altrosamine transaminase
MSYIPYGRQTLNKADIKAVLDVLNSDYLTQGPVVPKFEQAITNYTQGSYAVAANSATSALHIACLALGVGQGDIVWTSPITFVASANCALYCGAAIDFVDIDSSTYNMSVNELEAKLRIAKQKNKLPKVVIPVHLCGQSCDMEGVYRLSKEYGFNVIEDASHAIGGKYQEKPIGDCRYSDITVFSFHPVKIITTAEGGMAVTNSNELATKMNLFRSHGVTRDPQQMKNKPDGDWYYQQVDLGYNYRMTEMQAALGSSQMTRLESFVSRRHVIAKAYDNNLTDLPIKLPWQATDSYSAYHLYVICLELDGISKTRKEVFNFLRENKIGVNIHYIPVHTQPYYSSMGFKLGDYPIAEKYYQEALSIPMYPALNEQEQLRVCDLLKEAIGE